MKSLERPKGTRSLHDQDSVLVQGQTAGSVTFQPAAAVLQSPEELELIKSILARSEYLSRFRTEVCDLSVTDLRARLSHIRKLSIVVVELVQEWRKPFLRPYPFVWKGTNVLLKMAVELDFVHFARPVSADLGFSMLRNPFATEKALDQRTMAATDSKSIVEELDTDIARLRKAVSILLTEERLYGQYVPPKAFHSKLREEFRAGRLSLERRMAKERRANRLEAEKKAAEDKRAQQVKTLSDENQRLRAELAALQNSRRKKETTSGRMYISASQPELHSAHQLASDVGGESRDDSEVLCRRIDYRPESPNRSFDSAHGQFTCAHSSSRDKILRLMAQFKAVY